jgi:hypothetical protein
MRDADKSTLENFYMSVFGSANAFDWTHPQTAEIINVRFDQSTKLKFSRTSRDSSGLGEHSYWQTDTIILTEV